MLTRKLIAVLLCVFLLAGLIPAAAVAANVDSPEIAIPTQSIRKGDLPGQVNVLHTAQPGLINQIRTTAPAAPQTVTAKTFHSTVDAAASALRAGLVARRRSIVIGVKHDIYSEDLVYNLISSAYAHTGVPNEGDYLLWHWYSWEPHIYVSEKGVTIEYLITYYTSEAQEDQVDIAVDHLLAKLSLRNATDYAKVRGVYDWICTNVVYDYEGLEDPNNTIMYTAYGALINKTAVCQGYASLFYRLMLELGVDCRIITGTVDGAAHAWNIVKVDGVYYNVDPTFDAAYRQGDVDYCYFLVSDLNFLDHIPDTIYTEEPFLSAYPKAQSNYDESNGIALFGFCGAEGDFGENLIWALQDGILVIFGEGAMADYSPMSPPWWPYIDYITAAYLDEGVTSVGDYAFDNMKNLTEVFLPDTLKTIGKYSFFSCSALQNIELPYGLTEIQHFAFAYCTMPTIELPNSITNIEHHAFYLSKLKSIVIPDSITVLSELLFSSSSLESIVLPETLTTISDSAFFYCDQLQTIDLPDSVTYIGNGAFSYSGLTEIAIPDSVTALNSTVFANCSKLRHLTLGSGIASIDVSALSGCPSIENYTVSDANTVYASVDGVLFSKDLSTLIDYPEGRTDERYTVPESVTTIGRSAFEHSKLVSITLPSTLTTIEPLAFTESKNLTSLTIPEGVTRLREYILSYCSSLTSLTLPESLERIEENAFIYSGLTSLVIPKNVTYMGKWLFNNGNLETIEFEGNAPRFHESTFFCVTVNAYYPIGNETWTEEVMQNYDGELTWMAVCDVHEYESVVTAPTCTKGGYTTHTCTGCGLQYVDSYTDITDHIYTNDNDMICNGCGHDRTPILTTPMYRLYNPNSGEHFYTGSTEERDMLDAAGWNYEGIAWNAPIKGGAPVYRLYDPNSGDHHYTMSAEERDWLVSLGWNYEGVAWNSASTSDIPQFRLYNPNAVCGSHHYTSSTDERDWLVSLGWIYEGIGWYGTLK